MRSQTLKEEVSEFNDNLKSIIIDGEKYKDGKF